MEVAKGKFLRKGTRGGAHWFQSWDDLAPDRREMLRCARCGLIVSHDETNQYRYMQCPPPDDVLDGLRADQGYPVHHGQGAGLKMKATV